MNQKPPPNLSPVALFLPPEHRFPPQLGSVAAGFPLEAVEDRQRSVLLELLTDPGRYALRVADDSMLEAGIFAGDFVVVQSQQTARDGDLVVALIDDEELALKRLRHLDDERIQLSADHPKIDDRVLARARIKIQGKIVGQVRRYR